MEENRDRPSADHVHFECPSQLLKDFDATWKRDGKFKNRTDALMYAIRSFVKNGGALP